MDNMDDLQLEDIFISDVKVLPAVVLINGVHEHHDFSINEAGQVG